MTVLNQQKALAQSALHYQAVQRRLEAAMRRAYQDKLRDLLERLDTRFGGRYRTGWEWARLRRLGDWAAIRREIESVFAQAGDGLTDQLRRYARAVVKDAYERYIWEAEQASSIAADKVRREIGDAEQRILERQAEEVANSYKGMIKKALGTVRADIERRLRGEMLLGATPKAGWEAIKDRWLRGKRAEAWVPGSAVQAGLSDAVSKGRQRAARYVKKQGVVEDEIWQNVLDSHEVCALCSPLHGLTLKQVERELRRMAWPRGLWRTTRPPLHPN